jgi:hypothetical protein
MPQVADNSDVLALELERVIPKVRELYEVDDMFYANIQKRDVEQISSRQMRVPLEMASGGNFGYFDPDGGDLGRGGAPVWDKAVVSCVFMKEGIEYTKQAEWGTNSSRKAVVQVVRRLIARSLLEIRRQIDSQMMQSGNGVIGVVTSSSTPTAGTTQAVCTTDGFGVRLMRQGQTIQIFDTTLATNRGSATITYLDVVNSTIQFQPEITLTNGDKIVTSGISTPTSLPGLFGVPYHDSNSSSGTWLGFDRSTTPQVRASRVNGNSAALTLPLPRLAINNIGNRVGINNKFNPRAWMHPAQQQAYEEIGQLVIQIHKQAKDEALNMYFGDNMQMAGASIGIKPVLTLSLMKSGVELKFFLLISIALMGVRFLNFVGLAVVF